MMPRKKQLQYDNSINVTEFKTMTELACVMSDRKETPTDNINYTSLLSEEMETSSEIFSKECNIEIIQFFLKQYKNNVFEVAHKLYISKHTLHDIINAGYINLN